MINKCPESSTTTTAGQPGVTERIDRVTLVQWGARESTAQWRGSSSKLPAVSNPKIHRISGDFVYLYCDEYYWNGCRTPRGLAGGVVTMAERTTEDGDGTDQTGTGTEIVYSAADERPAEMDLSVAVIESLAEAKGITPVDIEQPLYDVVDPDALDRLFTDGESPVSGRVVFDFEAHEITVHSDGDILVRRVDSR